MISILLIILKIIGITLLVILGLVLLLLLLVLFVPVRYRLKGHYEDAFHCKGKITWLLHFISIHIEVEQEVVTSIRILGIPLSFFLKKKNVDVSVEDAVAGESSTAETSTKETAQTDAPGTEEACAQEEPKQIETKQQEEFSSVNKETNDFTEDNDFSENENVSFIKKIKNKIQSICHKIKQKIRDIIQKVNNFIDRIKDFFKNIKYKKKQLKRYLAILQSDMVKEAFSLCKNKIFKMLKHIFPRKLHADITFGFEDPATTGYTLAVYGMLPAFVGKNIILHPDFDKQIFTGNFHIKGAIRAWTLLYQVFCILLDKNCRKLYHIVKKEILNEHK